MFEHWGNTVYWDELSWEAFAALAAIIAAAVVGWRQMGLVQRQNEIASLGLKEALWDRRMAIYDTTRSFLGHIIEKGRVPGKGNAFQGGSGMTPTAVKLATSFHQAVDRAQFVLSQRAYGNLSRIQKAADRLGQIHEDASSWYEPDKSRLEAEAAALRAELVAAYNDVAALFGDDLRLQT